MRPCHRVLTSALIAALVASLVGVASPQSYDAARHTLDFGPDPLARSARLLGMGGITLLGDDPHNQITLWDFAGNPIGIAEDDTTSTFELRPASAAHAATKDLAPGFQRQTLAGSEYRVGYEGWRRTRERTAYGAIGEIGLLRLDQPYTETSERRSSLSDPNIQAVITGRVPWVLRSPRWRYALRALITKETSLDEYRAFVINPTGEYLDRNGTTLDQPLVLAPNEYDIISVGGGLALGYHFGPWMTAAAGGDFIQMDVQGTNDGKRYDAATHERRPVARGQASVTGRLGNHFEYGMDGRVWASNSPSTWNFSISAGIGADPFTGRGDLDRRKEFGSSFRSRARWVAGPLEVGAGVSTGFDRLTIAPPDPGNTSSFNYFLNTLYLRPSADSLALPDSVVYNRAERRSWDVGGGAAWTTGWREARLAIEAHTGREDLNQTLAGDGPRRKYSELRTGLELRLAPTLQGRTGWLYRSDDRDIFTYGNNYAGNGFTAGLGFHPARSVWSFDAGYLVYWYRLHDGDPAQPHGSRQQFLSQLRWSL